MLTWTKLYDETNSELPLPIDAQLYDIIGPAS